jgi:hypothetical protein
VLFGSCDNLAISVTPQNIAPTKPTASPTVSKASITPFFATLPIKLPTITNFLPIGLAIVIRFLLYIIF